MNKCTKCGTEFEGTFCPHCGTMYEEVPTTCPKCGAEHGENQMFCPNCGYSFRTDYVGDAPQQEAKPRGSTTSFLGRFDWRRWLSYLPMAFFALWAVLLWAFYAAPLLGGDGLFMEDVSLYQALGDTDLPELHIMSYMLIGLAGVACIYAACFAYVQFKGRSSIRRNMNYAAHALHVAVIVCTIVLSTQCKEFIGIWEKGSMVGVVIALTFIFAALQTTAFVLDKIFGAKATADPASEERQQALAQRRKEIRKRLKEDKTECASGGALCLVCAILHVLAYMSFSTLSSRYHYDMYGGSYDIYGNYGINWVYSLASFNNIISIILMSIATFYVLKNRLHTGLILTCCGTILNFLVSVVLIIAGISSYITNLTVFVLSVVSIILLSVKLSRIRKRITAEYDNETHDGETVDEVA